MKNESQRSEEIKGMIQALIQYYEGAGYEDYYERELKDKSAEVIRKMYKVVYETDEDNTRVEEEDEDR